MQPDERNRSLHGGIRLRLCLYAIIFAVMLVIPVVEVKTGVPLGNNRTTDRYHDPLSWQEVLAQLPATLLPYLVIAVLVIALVEWSIRRKMRGARSIFDSESETSDSPPKRFTAPWRVATIVYFAGAVIALYVYSKGDWSWDLPLLFPLAAFAPIFVSLGLLAIYTGEFQLKGGTFYRSTNHTWYWACVVTMLSIGIVLFLAGIGIIRT
jgi:hypothetical protein